LSNGTSEQNATSPPTEAQGLALRNGCIGAMAGVAIDLHKGRLWVNESRRPPTFLTVGES